MDAAEDCGVIGTRLISSPCNVNPSPTRSPWNRTSASELEDACDWYECWLDERVTVWTMLVGRVAVPGRETRAVVAVDGRVPVPGRETVPVLGRDPAGERTPTMGGWSSRMEGRFVALSGWGDRVASVGDASWERGLSAGEPGSGRTDIPGEGSWRDTTSGDLGMGLEVYMDGDGGTGMGFMEGEVVERGRATGNDGDEGEGDDGEAVR